MLASVICGVTFETSGGRAAGNVGALSKLPINREAAHWYLARRAARFYGDAPSIKAGREAQRRLTLIKEPRIQTPAPTSRPWRARCHARARAADAWMSGAGRRTSRGGLETDGIKKRPAIWRVVRRLNSAAPRDSTPPRWPPPI